MSFVLDASVALSWLLEDAGAGQAYATAVFDVLGDAEVPAHVPVTWGLELANVIAKSERRSELPPARSQAFLASIEAAPILCDAATDIKALHETLDLARRYRIGAAQNLRCTGRRCIQGIHGARDLAAIHGHTTRPVQGGLRRSP